MFIQVNSGYYILGSRGVAKKFGMDGKLKEDVSFAYHNAVRTGLPCEVISVLASQGGVEVAFFDKNDNMTRYNTNAYEDSAKLVMDIFSKQQFFKCFKAEGTADGERYNQMLFIYRDECPLNFERLFSLERIA